MSAQENGKRAYQVSIQGRVQGVGFRYSAVRAAERFGVAGWVRNEPDGSVSAFCAGSEEATRKFIKWCRQGPSMAHVSNVDVQEVPYRGRYSSFSVAV